LMWHLAQLQLPRLCPQQAAGAGVKVGAEVAAAAALIGERSGIGRGIGHETGPETRTEEASGQAIVHHVGVGRKIEEARQGQLRERRIALARGPAHPVVQKEGGEETDLIVA